MIIGLILFSLLASTIAQVCNCNGRGYCAEGICKCNYGSYGTNCENVLEFYHADLSGANEVPPVNTQGKGYARASYDRLTNFVTVVYKVSGLSGTITAAHIHKAPLGVNGPVAVPINIATSMAAMTPTSLNWDPSVLMSSGTYVNVHSTVAPGGEVRGQLVPITSLPLCPTGACGAFEACVSELLDFACYCLPGFLKAPGSGSCSPTDFIGSYLVSNSKVQLFRFLFRDRSDSSGNGVTIGNLGLMSDPALSDGKGTLSSGILTTSLSMITQQTCFVLHTTWMANSTFRALRVRANTTSPPVLAVQFHATGSIQLVNQHNQVIHSTRSGVLRSTMTMMMMMMNYISICYRPTHLVINANGARVVSWRIPAVTAGSYIVQLGPNFAGVIDEFFAYNEDQSLLTIDTTFQPSN